MSTTLLDDSETLVFDRTIVAGIGDKSYPTNKIKSTRYTPYNFIYKNIIEQFTLHFMNFYFLMLAFLQLWPLVSPVRPILTWAPLICIFTATALKDATEDLSRYLSDNKFNSRLYTIYNHKIDGIAHVKSEKIRVGDIVIILPGQEFPCDCVPLRIDNGSSIVHITTASLDGESTVKKKLIPRLLDVHWISNSIQIDVTKASPSLNFCPGALHYCNQKETLSVENFIFAGSKLSSPSPCFCVCVFAGPETRASLNTVPPKMKRTFIDSGLNAWTRRIFNGQLTASFIFTILHLMNRDNVWYTGTPANAFTNFVIIPIRFFLLSSLCIPISFKITIDLCRIYNSVVFGFNEEIRGKCRNSSSVEVAGSITHLCLDKTGTLTKNQLSLKEFINESRMNYAELPSITEWNYFWNSLKSGIVTDYHCLSLLCAMTCHTLEVDNTRISGESKDEEAILGGLLSPSFMLIESEHTHVTFSLYGVEYTVHKASTFPFSSDRRTMTVIISNPDWEYAYFMTKGADDVLLSPESSFSTTVNYLGSSGYRTLVFGYQCLKANLVSRILNDIGSQREVSVRALSKIYASYEEATIPIAISAVEDQLQDRVGEVLANLRAAGIKCFILTGDKSGTALQIARTVGLLGFDEEIVEISEDGKGVLLTSGDDFENELRSILTEYKSCHENLNAVAFNALVAKARILRRVTETSAIIVSRCSPSQKATIVKMLRLIPNAVVAACGDGLNDVSMIQEADVGFGVEGVEGMSASRAADLVIPEISSLDSAILVCGQRASRSIGFIAQISFYKSLLVGMAQVFFNFYTGFSGQSVLNQWSLSMYNVMFTYLPPVLAVINFSHPAEYMIEHPELYRHTQQKKHFNASSMLNFTLHAFWNVIILLIFYGIFMVTSNSHGAYSLPEIGLYTITSIMISVTFNIVIETNNWHPLNTLSIIGSFLFFVFSTLLYENVSDELMGTATASFKSPIFWLTCIMISFWAELPSLCAKYLSLQGPIHWNRTRSARLFRAFKGQFKGKTIFKDIYISNFQ